MNSRSWEENKERNSIESSVHWSLWIYVGDPLKDSEDYFTLNSMYTTSALLTHSFFLEANIDFSISKKLRHEEFLHGIVSGAVSAYFL